MRWWKKMTKKVTNPEQSKTLMSWQSKYESAKQKYTDTLNQMENFEKYYDGNRFVKGNPNSNRAATKLSVNVRNIAYDWWNRKLIAVFQCRK